MNVNYNEDFVNFYYMKEENAQLLYTKNISRSILTYLSRIDPEHKKYTSLLDLGCGPGILCKEFAQNNFQVTGIDISPSMINYAAKNNNTSNSAYYVKDARNFCLDGKYNLFTMVFGVMQYIEDLNQLSQVLKSINEHQYDANCPTLFIFDLYTEKGIKKYDNQNFFYNQTSHHYISFRGIYNEESKKLYAYYDIFQEVDKENALCKHISQRLDMKYHSCHEVQKLLQEYGWKDILPYDLELKTPITNFETLTTDRYLIVAKK